MFDRSKAARNTYQALLKESIQNNKVTPLRQAKIGFGITLDFEDWNLFKMRCDELGLKYEDVISFIISDFAYYGVLSIQIRTEILMWNGE